MHPALRRLIAGAAVSVCCCTFAVQAQTALTADELRQAAMVALGGGDAQTARRFAEALLTRDGEDRNAYLILARAARDLGDMPPARAAARKAWDLSNTDAQRYSAALITAQVLSSEGKRTRAQLWLRRAAQHAPNDALRARAERDFRYVKQQNPWQTDVTFTFAPNSNINNGSARDRSRLNYAISELLFGESIEFSLNDEAQAIAGLEVGGALRTRYRFHQTPDTAHDVKFALSYRTFAITDDLGSSAISGSDFAFGAASLGYGFRTFNMARKGEFAADVEAGQTWYGGARYASFLRGQAQQTLATGARQKMRFGVEVERQWGQSTPDRDLFGLSSSVTHGFASGNSGFAGLYLTATQSDDATIEYTEVLLRTGFSLKKPVMGAAVQFGLGASWRDYDVSRDSRDGRQDRRIFADVTATFTDIDYYGFNPSLTLSASRTDSNIGLYDVNRVGLNIGIKSAF
ncbi:surface lipoprotein assembly modifier [Sulfitobacter sp. F26204]|uniref:tetratricopeptide repeat protein n=1 Tax=Sulfitobacter sp. F26204 TaxID=2996014 RepID=UPI00225E0945|nr:surface lipoprotein assembly modifier [Sulfitobacter sp. F26204]MCX7559162.1 surface lipoprotein assembly modifier [Sulfitobacter sp. F26204]